MMELNIVPTALTQIVVFGLITLPIPMVMGMLWYGPLFGQPWMRAIGKTEDELKMGPGLMIATALTWLLSSLVVATGVAFVVYSPLVAATFASGGGVAMPLILTLGLTTLAYLGLGLNHIIMAKNYQGQPTALALIDFGYQHICILSLAFAQFWLFASGWLG